MKYVLFLAVFLSFSAMADVIVKTGGSGCPAFVNVAGNTSSSATSTALRDINSYNDMIIDICKISYIENSSYYSKLYMDNYGSYMLDSNRGQIMNFIYVHSSSIEDVLLKLPMAQIQNVEPSQ